MRRNSANDHEPEGNDSFLDIVANIVGILIILVMVVSVRVKNAPALSIKKTPVEKPAAAPVDLSEKREAIENANRDLSAHEQEAMRQLEENRALEVQVYSRRMQRERLSTSVTAIDYQLKEKQNELNETQQAELALKREFAEQRAKLDALEQQRALAAGVETTPEKMVSVSTPISKTVYGKEMHFRLSGGRVAYIPFELLLESAFAASRGDYWKLNGVPAVTGQVAPIDGFAMRYTVGRVTVNDGSGRTLPMLTRVEVVPISDDMGETIEEALAPNSLFRRAIAKGQPKKTTMTLWTYPDSFEIYRALKTELFKAGFASAGWPQSAGKPITSVLNGGARSAAQ